MSVVKTPLRLDPGDPLSRGLVGFWPLTEPAGLLSNDLGPWKRTGLAVNGPTRVATARGRAVQFLRSSNQYINVGTTLGFGSIDAMTVAAWVFIPTTSDQGAIFKIGNNTDFSGGDGFAFGVGNNELENSGNQILVLYEGSRWIRTGINAGTGWRHMAVTIEASGTVSRVFLDGLQIYTNTGTAPKTVGGSGASIAQIGGYVGSTGVNRYFTGTLLDMRVWRRALRPAEVRRLYAQAWAGTERDRRRVNYNPNTGITATLSATLADVTLAAEGVLPIRGTLAATLADTTLAAEGVLPIRGTLVATLADTTLAAEGTLGTAPTLTGTLAATLGDVSLSAFGVVGTPQVAAGVSRRTRRGARRVYLPEPELPPIVMPANIVRARNSLPDDDEEAWILLN